MRYSDQIAADQCGRYKEIILYMMFLQCQSAQCQGSQDSGSATHNCGVNEVKIISIQAVQCIESWSPMSADIPSDI